MKSILTAIMIGSMACIATLCAAQTTGIDEKYEATLRDKLCPQPKEIKFFDGNCLLEKASRVAISTEKTLSENEKQSIKKIFSQYWKFVPEIDFGVKAENGKLGMEGSSVKIGGNITIDARRRKRGQTGAQNAAPTRRIEPQRRRF